MTDSSSRRGRAIRETAAALGVILSLLFVGIEIRANTRAVQGSTLQGIADQSIDLQMSIVENDNLVRLMPRIIEGELLPDSLDSQDRYRVLVTYLSILRVAENRFRQAELGTVPEGGYEQFGGRSILFGTPYFRELWPIVRSNVTDEFAAFLEREYRLTN